MYINHNSMASNVSNTLTSHYNNLATSTERLSSGLRVNSAADDAAGLAIRELMRADISALQQGVRNANDAISLIQTADGALGIIDEKLIRMKELAEQAATGTYDSTQRLMIESEYQAMASEITRIANATDFNGIKLLNGNLEGTHDGSKMEAEGALKVHFGTANDSAEDYYYIEIEEMTAQALGVGNASTFEDVKTRASDKLHKSMEDQIKQNENLSAADKGLLLGQLDQVVSEFEAAVDGATDLQNAYKYWNSPDLNGTDTGFLEAGKDKATSELMSSYLSIAPKIAGADTNLKAAGTKINTAAGDFGTDGTAASDNDKKIAQEMINLATQALDQSGLVNWDTTNSKYAKIEKAINDFKAATLDNATAVNTAYKTAANTLATALALPAADVDNETTEAIKAFEGGLRDTEKEKLNYAFGQAAIYNLANRADTSPDGVKADGTANPKAFDAYGIKAGGFSIEDQDGDDTTDTDLEKEVTKMLNQALTDAYDKTKDMDFAGHTIETQEDAQKALVALDNAITQKDKTRAHLGALQNRLENTVSNLTVQSENLQAAESRISDVDVATEMTNFVRNQILTQSAVAMLSQANSMPQMALQLIG